MKQFLYLLTFFASVGTIGLVATKPQLVQQGISFIRPSDGGVQESSDPASDSGENHLTKFLADYPYANREDSLPKQPLSFVPPRSQANAVAAIPHPESPKPPAPAEKSEYRTVGYTAPVPVSQPTPTPQAASAPQPVPAPQPAPFSPLQTDIPANEGIGTASTPVRPASVDGSTAGFASSSGRIPTNSGVGLFDQWSDPPPIPPAPSSPPPQPIPQVPLAVVVPQTPPQAPPVSPPTPTPPQASPTPWNLEQNREDPFLQAAGPTNPLPWNADAPSAPAPSPMPQPVPVAQPTVQPMPQPPAVHAATAPATKPETVQAVPPHHYQSPGVHPQAGLPKVSSQFQINPSIMVEEVPCHGTEMVARVGTEVILMCDILPQLRRVGMRLLRENLKQLPPEKQAEVSEEEKEQFIEGFIGAQYSAFLQDQINIAMLFNDFKLAKSKEEREFFEKKMAEDFDQQDIPEMLKEFGLKDLAALKRHLKEEFGSSLDQERMLTTRTRIAQQWVMYSVKTAEGECTHDEMMEFYTANRSMFETKARCRWQEMIVLISPQLPEKDAWHKIVWMGNQVALNGAAFDEIAKNNSDGFTASKGGIWDWTSRGSLTSKELEEAIFTLPVGKLSPIIKSEKGLHIVRVLERDEDKVTPFIEAQVTIREKIRQQRRRRYEEEYFAELKKRYPTIILRDSIDFKAARPGVAANSSSFSFQR